MALFGLIHKLLFNNKVYCERNEKQQVLVSRIQFLLPNRIAVFDVCVCVKERKKERGNLFDFPDRMFVFKGIYCKLPVLENTSVGKASLTQLYLGAALVFLSIFLIIFCR